MDLIQDFKRMAFCFAIMAGTVAYVALGTNTNPDYAMQRHPAGMQMPPSRVFNHRGHGPHPMPWTSLVAHRTVSAVTYVAGFVD